MREKEQRIYDAIAAGNVGIDELRQHALTYITRYAMEQEEHRKTKSSLKCLKIVLTSIKSNLELGEPILSEGGNYGTDN